MMPVRNTLLKILLITILSIIQIINFSSKQKGIILPFDSRSSDAITPSISVQSTVASRLLIFQAEEIEFPKNPEGDFDPINLPNDELLIRTMNLKNITIEIDGNPIPLKTAVRDDRIRFTDFLCNARKDAENGFCRETFTSKHGVATFLYRYPELDLELIYDIYETPDGENHLVRGIGLYKHGCTYKRVFGEYSEEYKILTMIDREDWGLTFTEATVTPTDITLNCSQVDGQQIGQLSVYCFDIFSQKDSTYPVSLNASSTPHHITPQFMLEMNGKTQLHINWTDIYGPLAEGSYRLILGVKDIYDETQVHPLMDNFYDEQNYYIDFTIE